MTNHSSNKTILYFSPHQDDELLSMGIDICNSISMGNDVHVVLCTEGSKSVVRQQMVDCKECNRHPGTHKFHLTEKEFIEARDKEFRESCRALGIVDGNVHIPKDRFVDGKLTVCNSKELILQYLNTMGKDCVICTLDPNHENNRQHRDHKALGYAAVELFNEGVISELRLFAESYYSDCFRHEMDVVQAEALPVIETASVSVHEKLKKAARAYSRWEPEKGRYAVGYHSIGDAFDTLLKTNTSYCYVCTRKTAEVTVSTCKKLIVSLTSYPARINSVVQSLAKIFEQRLTPDAVVLWLSSTDFPGGEKDLPEKLVKMVAEDGLSIRWCEDDLKPHNKYFWTFKEYPDSLVITVDDDILYHNQVTENLYRSYLLHPQAVSAARICFVPISEEGKFPPYEFWPTGVDVYVSRPSMQLCATGVGGVLYPTGLFSQVKELFDAETIKKTCLFEDDLWLKAMEIMAGIPVVVAEKFKGLHYTPDSQDIGLWHKNIEHHKSQEQLLLIQKEIDRRYGKDTFIKKLTNTAVGENLLGNAVLCTIVRYYQNEVYRLENINKNDLVKMKQLERSKSVTVKLLEETKQRLLSLTKENNKTVERLKKLQSETKRVKLELKNVKNSWSFKTGRVITWFPRKIKYLFK